MANFPKTLIFWTLLCLLPLLLLPSVRCKGKDICNRCGKKWTAEQNHSDKILSCTAFDNYDNKRDGELTHHCSDLGVTALNEKERLGCLKVEWHVDGSRRTRRCGVSSICARFHEYKKGGKKDKATIVQEFAERGKDPGPNQWPNLTEMAGCSFCEFSDNQEDENMKMVRYCNHGGRRSNNSNFFFVVLMAVGFFFLLG